MKRENLIKEVMNLLDKHDFAELKVWLIQLNPVDIAEILAEVPDETLLMLFRILPKDLAADTFSEMDGDEQEKLLNNFTDQEVRDVVYEMGLDDTVDMLEEMPANVVRRVLSKASPEDRKTINELLKYPEDSAGAVMTTELMRLKENMTVTEALDWIRTHGDDKEDIYTCYVTSKDQILMGVITVRELLLDKHNSVIGDIMERNTIEVRTNDDQEVAAKLFDRYNFTALPVVDMDNHLVGIITVDDAIDVMTEETTEDFQKLAATTPSEEPYLKTSVFSMAGHRIVWLIVLMVSDLISGGILQSFQDALTALPILISFIPMLTDTGGNAGSQASTLVIRGLALKEITVKDAFKVMWKEFRVAVICGAALSVLNFARMLIQFPGQMAVSIAVSVALFFTVIMAKAIGGLLPIAATKLKLDPALMASPLITTIVDSGSLLIYLNVAKALLHI